ncbi:hypothetical protein ACVWZ8_000288 [Arthrobacter sp. UYCu723]
MDGNWVPEVVQAGRGGTESGATVTHVARLLGTVRPCNPDPDGGNGCGGHSGQLGVGLLLAQRPTRHFAPGVACFWRRLIVSDPLSRLSAMDGNREPEVVQAGRGGAESGATVTDVPTDTAVTAAEGTAANSALCPWAWVCFWRRLILSDPFGRL